MHCIAMQWIERIKAVIKLALQAAVISNTLFVATDTQADLYTQQIF